MKYSDISVGGTDTGAALNINRRIGFIQKYIDLTDKVILDCGCGGGDYLAAFSTFSNNVYGIDYDAQKVRKASDILPEKVFQGDIEDLQFEDNYFDIVFLNEVIEHIPDERKALKEIYRVLKNGGTLVMMAPNRFYPFETHGVQLKYKKRTVPKLMPFIPYLPIQWGEILFTYPARNYFPWELKRLIKTAGYEIIQHAFISQTFEGIGGHNHVLYKILRPIFRRIFFILEDIPFIRVFTSVTQVMIVKKL